MEKQDTTTTTAMNENYYYHYYEFTCTNSKDTDISKRMNEQASKRDRESYSKKGKTFVLVPVLLPVYEPLSLLFMLLHHEDDYDDEPLFPQDDDCISGIFLFLVYKEKTTTRQPQNKIN